MNVSEGRDGAVLAALGDAAGDCLLDLHRDPDHHRGVLTLAAPEPAEVEQAVRAVAAEAVARIDLGHHRGAHPRFGAVDVVPFVPLVDGSPLTGPGGLEPAVAARDRFAAWAAERLGLPCFYYGPERTLPEVRRGAFVTFPPDAGPRRPHPTAGACAVGARPALVAYNLWLVEPDLEAARRTAARLRCPQVRALGLAVGGAVQVSCNLLSPLVVGPADVADDVADILGPGAVARAELVGLAPAAVVAATPPARWAELDLDPGRTVEARLAARRRTPPGD